VREVLGSNPEPIKSPTSCQQLATAATLMCGPWRKAAEMGTAYSWHSKARASAENFPGEANGKEDQKIAKKYQKIALLNLFQSGGRGQRNKRPKNSKKTLKNIKKGRKIPCMKIQGGGTAPLASRCWRPCPKGY